MANQYSHIGAGWASAAQKGRDRAKRNFAVQQKEKSLELQNKADIMKQEQLAQQTLEYNHASAEMLAKQYRPEDLEKMQDIAKQAESEIKAQLEFFGDDINAFMRGGGQQHLRQYTDTILNSDQAKIIRANHKNLVQYLDASKKRPDLVSNADRENYELWQNGTHKAFVYSGQLNELQKPKDENYQNTGYQSEGHAYLDVSDNYWKALANYNIEKGTNYNRHDITDDMLINYLNQSLTPRQSPTSHKDEYGKYIGNSQLASDQFKIINQTINRGYQGDFRNFWEDKANKNARINLEQRGGSGTFDKVDDGQVYRTTIFSGQEDELVKSLFNLEEYDGSLNRKSDVNNLLRQGAITAYDNNGNALDRNETFGFFYGNNLDVMGIQYALKVQDRENETTKLLTYDDVGEEGDSHELWKNKSKDGTIILTLRDRDTGRKIFFPTKDDFIYLEIDINNATMAKRLDDAVGKMNYTAKTTAQTSPSEYAYVPGEKFSFTGDRPRQAINALYNTTDKYFKHIGVKEFEPISYAALMTHALSNTEHGVSPEDFMQTVATSDDPTIVEAREALKSGDSVAYVEAMKKGGILATEKEARTLLQNMNAIINGFKVLKTQLETEEKTVEN